MMLRSIQPDQDVVGEGQTPGEMGFALNYLKTQATRDLVVLSDRQTERVYSIALSNDGRILATGDNDGTVRLRDPATGHVSKSLLSHRFGVIGLVFSSDGGRLVSVAADGIPPKGAEVLVWDLVAQRLQARLEGMGEPHPSTCSHRS